MSFDIGARIKELREAQGLSTNKLSNMAGLSQSYVRKLEKGESRPTVESVELLCHALGITFEDFIKILEEMMKFNLIFLLKRNDGQLDFLFL